MRVIRHRGFSWRPAVIAAVLMVGPGGCAVTSDPGWTGAGAVPFDRAKADCAADAGSADVNDEAFIRCMDGKGWRRS